MDNPTRPNAFHAGYDIVSDEFYVSASYREPMHNDRVHIAKPIELVERTPGAIERIGPMLLLGTQGMQSLMNALWGAGFRPKEICTAGQLAATEKHLEDMRRIAFAKIAVDPLAPQPQGM